jgi:hypothetical protein
VFETPQCPKCNSKNVTVLKGEPVTTRPRGGAILYRKVWCRCIDCLESFVDELHPDPNPKRNTTGAQ